MKIDRESNNCQTRKMSQSEDYSASPASGDVAQVKRRNRETGGPNRFIVRSSFPKKKMCTRVKAI